MKKTGIKERIHMYKAGDKVYCATDMKNYIVAHVDTENKVVLGIDITKETLSQFNIQVLKEEDICSGWMSYAMDFKYKKDAPTFQEIFAYIEGLGKADQLEDIRVFNTNRKYITDREQYCWNTWKSLQEHPMYKSKCKVERFSYSEDGLLIYYDRDKRVSES